MQSGISQKAKAGDYLREYATQSSDEWFRLLVTQVIQTHKIPNSSFLNQVYHQFLLSNGLENATDGKLSHAVTGNHLLPNARGRARFRVTTVIHVSFLRLTDKRVAAGLASDESPEQELVFDGPRVKSSLKDALHCVEGMCGDHRFVVALEDLAVALDPDNAHIERIVEDE